MKLQFWPLIIRFLICQFVGIIIFSIGIGAIFPPLNYIAAPIVCPGGSMSTNTESYSYRPGEVFTSITQICGNKATGQVEDVTWPATLIAGVMYGIVFFFLSFLLTFFVNKRLNKMRISFSKVSDNEYSSQYAPIRNQQEAEEILRRIQDRLTTNSSLSSTYDSDTNQSNNVKKRLEELRDLHTSGLIDTDEYERKKEEILNEL